MLPDVPAATPLLNGQPSWAIPRPNWRLPSWGVGAIVDRPTFRRVASQMETAAAAGSSDAMLALSSLYVCHDPLGPDIANATIWRERALGAGNKRVELDQLFETGTAGPDMKSRIALLRSNALSGQFRCTCLSHQCLWQQFRQDGRNRSGGVLARQACIRCQRHVALCETCSDRARKRGNSLRTP